MLNEYQVSVSKNNKSILDELFKNSLSYFYTFHISHIPACENRSILVNVCDYCHNCPHLRSLNLMKLAVFFSSCQMFLNQTTFLQLFREFSKDIYYILRELMNVNA